MKSISINQETCTKCKLCVEVCPARIFQQESMKEFPNVVFEKSCLVCGHCVAICPQDAVIHSGYPAEKVAGINEDLIPSEEQLFELIKSRRSIREFKDEPIEREVIEKIIDAARLAPTAQNNQSTHYLVIQDKETLDGVRELSYKYMAKIIKMLQNPIQKTILRITFGRQIEIAIRKLDEFKRFLQGLDEGQDLILWGAPCVIIFHAKARDAMSDANTNLALQNAALMCHAMKLGGFYTGYVVVLSNKDKRLSEYLKIPKGHKIYGGLAIGYPKFKYNKRVERNPAKITWV